MNKLAQLITEAKHATVNDSDKNLAISCLDYTSLNATDTDDDIRTLCQRAITPRGEVAAICIYPQFVDFAKRELTDSRINIATVANFPTGDFALDAIISDVKANLFDGANEIDLVFPYHEYLAGNKTTALTLVKAVKHICGNATLKVIIETSALNDANTIATISQYCLMAGADFLKTSTGKMPIGATLEAAAIMLQTIKNFQLQYKTTKGFKAAGGVRTAKEAAEYIKLAKLIIGETWPTPQNFRIGASSLLDDLLS